MPEVLKGVVNKDILVPFLLLMIHVLLTSYSVLMFLFISHSFLLILVPFLPKFNQKMLMKGLVNKVWDLDGYLFPVHLWLECFVMGVMLKIFWAQALISLIPRALPVHCWRGNCSVGFLFPSGLYSCVSCQSLLPGTPWFRYPLALTVWFAGLVLGLIRANYRALHILCRRALALPIWCGKQLLGSQESA